MSQLCHSIYIYSVSHTNRLWAPASRLCSYRCFHRFKLIRWHSRRHTRLTASEHVSLSPYTPTSPLDCWNSCYYHFLISPQLALLLFSTFFSSFRLRSVQILRTHFYTRPCTSPLTYITATSSVNPHFSCLPQFRFLTNWTQTTTTHGMGTWRLGFAHVSKPPTVSATPKEGEEDKLEAWQLKADKAAG